MEKEKLQKSLSDTAREMIQQGLNLVQSGKDLLTKISYNTISVVTRWYNEEMIAPFFLDHYSYADEIVVLLSTETTDNTREIIEQFANTRIVDVSYENGYNVRLTTEMIKEQVRQQTTDWVICVEADEFVFPKDFKDPRIILGEVEGNLVYANMWQVYRHRTEVDLTTNLKAIWLRRYGPPERGNGKNKRMDCKPIIVRSGVNPNWGVGLHDYEPNPNIHVSKTVFDGAHWKMADPQLAIARRLRGRRDSGISQENLRKGWACDDFDITEEQIRQECKQHRNDPQLF